MFDLPHPLGPTTAVTDPGKARSTFSKKDLKPEISTRFNRSTG
jgi:hypothetical protein